MGALPKIGDLSSAIDLIAQPLLLEVLIAIDEGKALEEALPPDADAVALGAAVQRLATIRAVRPSTTAPFGRHTLTPRGTYLLRLLVELDAAIATEAAVGTDH